MRGVIALHREHIHEKNSESDDPGGNCLERDDFVCGNFDLVH